MKTYVKPTVDVVELSVKENMAALPAPVTGTQAELNLGGYNGTIVATVYDLTEVTLSNMA